MTQWGPQGFSRQGKATGVGTLQDAVNNLSAKAKQAFYAAATRKQIARGTWNGCAFNAGSKELGFNIKSLETAAQLFEMPVANVRNFISLWDRSSYSCDSEATEALRVMLEEADLFSEPGFAGQEFEVLVHESDRDATARRFSELVERLEEDVEFEAATASAFELINS